MRVGISSDFIGSSRSLVYDGKSYSWYSKIPKDVWTLGSKNYTHRNIEFVIDSVGEQISKSPCEIRKKIYKSLRNEEDDEFIPWSLVLDDGYFKTYIQNLLDQLWCFLNKWNDTYYMKALIDNRAFLESFKCAHVDLKKLELYKSKERKNQLRSFIPNSDGVLDKISYDQFGSQTGRLTVKSGPQILTLKKEFRDILKSRYKNGKIFEIDFVSMEPRVALSLIGKNPGDDVYISLSQELFENKYERDVIKLAVLSTLYGSKSLSGIDIEWQEKRKIQAKIRDAFQIKKIENNLLDQINKNGYIESRLGRRIFPKNKKKNILYNNFIQSAAADIALIAFKKMISKISRDIEPLFVIHDAIILDVSEEASCQISEISSIDISYEGIEINLPVKISILND